MKKDDFRIVFKSALLPNSPYTYLTELPDELKAASSRLLMMHRPRTRLPSTACPTARTRNSTPATHKDFQGTVEMIQFVDEMRKKQQS